MAITSVSSPLSRASSRMREPATRVTFRPPCCQRRKPLRVTLRTAAGEHCQHHRVDRDTRQTQIECHLRGRNLEPWIGRRPRDQIVRLVADHHRLIALAGAMEPNYAAAI